MAMSISNIFDKPRIDGSSDDSFLRTYEALARLLGEEQRVHLAGAVQQLTAEAYRLANLSAASPKSLLEVSRRYFDGLGYEAIMKRAGAVSIERGPDKTNRQ